MFLIFFLSEFVWKWPKIREVVTNVVAEVRPEGQEVGTEEQEEVEDSGEVFHPEKRQNIESLWKTCPLGHPGR